MISNFKFLFYFILFCYVEKEKLVLVQCGFWSCGHVELSIVCGRHRLAANHLGFFLIFRQRSYFLWWNVLQFVWEN
jgi:hypothetical protein